MKKSYAIIVFVIFSLQILSLNAANAPKPGKGAPMPENIKVIVHNSCIACHSSTGNHMAASILNIDKWNDYNSKQQFRKAKKMCKMVSKGIMPPNKARKEKPEITPTDTQIKAICDWSGSLKK